MKNKIPYIEAHCSRCFSKPLKLRVHHLITALVAKYLDFHGSNAKIVDYPYLDIIAKSAEKCIGVYIREQLTYVSNRRGGFTRDVMKIMRRLRDYEKTHGISKFIIVLCQSPEYAEYDFGVIKLLDKEALLNAMKGNTL